MKTLEIWSPFRELDEVQNRLSSFFGKSPELFGRFSPINGNGGMTLPNWSPEVDISEDDKEYLVTTDLPEMKKEEVKVTVEDGVLSISGERKSDKEEKKIPSDRTILWRVPAHVHPPRRCRRDEDRGGVQGGRVAGTPAEEPESETAANAGEGSIRIDRLIAGRRFSRPGVRMPL